MNNSYTLAQRGPDEAAERPPSRGGRLRFFIWMLFDALGGSVPPLGYPLPGPGALPMPV